MRLFATNCRSWLRHSWKLQTNCLARDPLIVIHGNSCIILYMFRNLWYINTGDNVQHVVWVISMSLLWSFTANGIGKNVHLPRILTLDAMILFANVSVTCFTSISCVCKIEYSNIIFSVSKVESKPWCMCACNDGILECGVLCLS